MDLYFKHEIQKLMLNMLLISAAFKFHFHLIEDFVMLMNSE